MSVLPPISGALVEKVHAQNRGTLKDMAKEYLNVSNNLWAIENSFYDTLFLGDGNYREIYDSHLKRFMKVKPKYFIVNPLYFVSQFEPVEK